MCQKRLKPLVLTYPKELKINWIAFSLMTDEKYLIYRINESWKRKTFVDENELLNLMKKCPINHNSITFILLLRKNM